jgi:hypothetical protein
VAPSSLEKFIVIDLLARFGFACREVILEGGAKGVAIAM